MDHLKDYPAPKCPCGCFTLRRIARRHTADSARIELWSDGNVTSGMGFGIRGIGTARSDYEMELDVQAGWLAFSEAELYDFSEISRLIKSARKAIRQTSEEPRIAMLRYFNGERIRTMKSGRTFRWIKNPTL